MNYTAANGILTNEILNGAEVSAFDNLADLITAANSGDTIYVTKGDGTNNGLAGQVNLPDGVNLVGEGTCLVLTQTIEPQGEPSSITGPIDCGGNNTISGFQVIDFGNVTISHNCADEGNNLKLTNNPCLEAL